MKMPTPEEHRADIENRYRAPQGLGVTRTAEQFMEFYDALIKANDVPEYFDAVQAPESKRDSNLLAAMAFNAGYGRALTKLQRGESEDDDDLSIEQLLSRMPPAQPNLAAEHRDTQSALLQAIRRAAETTDAGALLALVEAYYKLPPVDEDDYDPDD